MVNIGDWVKYTTERIEDPFGDGEEPKNVYAVVTSIIGDGLCTITWCEYEPDDDYPLFRGDIVPVGKISVVCPAVGMRAGGIMYCTRDDNNPCAEKAVNPDLPPIPTKGSNAVPPTNGMEVKINCSDSLFDLNEKDPVMRALNIVKEYCRVSVDQLTDYDFSISEFNHKREAYKDVINFIENHQNKCLAVKQSKAPKSAEIEHAVNERDWFQKRMKEYKESFFRVCDIVEHSDCANIIKKLIEEERKRY